MGGGVSGLWMGGVFLAHCSQRNVPLGGLVGQPVPGSLKMPPHSNHV